MDLRIDAASAVPIYAQVVEQVKVLVAIRALRTGDSMPSVRELAATLRINRNTAAKAYQILEAEGVLQTRAGQGSFVGEEGPRWSKQERMSRLERSLDLSLVEAYHLEIPFDEVPAVLDRRIGSFQARGRGSDQRKKGE